MDIVSFSEKGRRLENQDSYGYIQAHGIDVFVVADGCGAYKGSGIAAKKFCEIILQEIRCNKILINKHSKIFMLKFIRYCAKKTFQILREKRLYKACTTFAMICICKDKTIYMHAGDSRIYKVNRNKMIWHTRDHSMVQHLLDHKMISKKEVYTHKFKHILYNVIGPTAPIDPTIRIGRPLKNDDFILLCTDGYWPYLARQKLVRLAQTNNIRSNIEKHIKLIKESGLDDDNITVLAIRV